MEESDAVPTSDEGAKDVLKIYGFSFDFPTEASLEFNPKFKRETGDIAIKSPNKSKVFVSWGELAKVQGKIKGPEEHAKFSLEKVARGALGKPEVVEHEELTVNGHVAIYNRVRVQMPSKGFFRGKPTPQEVMSLHLHCGESARFFVIYGTDAQQESERQAAIIRGIIGSFKCH